MRVSSSVRRQQILDVATRLFAESGYRGTTTREISLGVGINEALLFRHFPNKEELYWAVIDAKRRSGRGRELLAQQLSAPGDTPAAERQKFVSIAENILRRLRGDLTLFRLLLFSALENHRLADRFFRRYVSDYYETLADYIRRRMRAGVWRRTDPLLAARAFLGMVFYHSLIQDIFGVRRHLDFPFRRVAGTITDIWLEGMSKRAMPDHRAARHPGKAHRSK
jgi:TetR/AcrR family transcriptional regulator